MLALRHWVLWLSASALLLGIVVWGSLETGVDIPTPGGSDKVAHFGTYGFLTVWFTGMFARGRYWAVALALLGLGLAMEIAQYLMAAGRQADPYDMAANSIGVLVGLGLAARATGGWAPKAEAWLSRS